MKAKLRGEWRALLGEVSATRPANTVEVLEEDRTAGCIRQLIRYESEPGERVEAYRLLPLDRPGPWPAVVVLHSTVNHTIRQPAGLDGPPEKHFALRLAQRGFAAVCPRCFLWSGEGTDYEAKARAFLVAHPGTLGMAKMLYDAERAVDVIAATEGVDAGRIGAIGHSLGAKEVLYLMAFDERVRAGVSSEGGVGVRFSNWEAPWYLGPRAAEANFPREHHELLALAAPRPLLVVGGESADGRRTWPLVAAAQEAWRAEETAPPRLGLYLHGQGHAVPPEAVERIESWIETYV
jgi:dienelactone hydrolase